MPETHAHVTAGIDVTVIDIQQRIAQIVALEFTVPIAVAVTSSSCAWIDTAVVIIVTITAATATVTVTSAVVIR